MEPRNTIAVDDPGIAALLTEWHEAGREEFERDFPNLNYDTCERKTARQRRKYICLDSGISGAFVIERTTGDIYGIKAYGVPHKGKLIGRLGEVTGIDLVHARWK